MSNLNLPALSTLEQAYPVDLLPLLNFLETQVQFSALSQLEK
jgi:hypothetical protein